MKRYLCSLVALGLLLGTAGDAASQPTYTFTTLDVPGASFPTTSINAYGINDAGQIVGDYSVGRTDHGFLFENGSYTTLDVPGASFTGAYGINASGQIVGDYFDARGGHGFLFDNGIYTTLDAPGSMRTSANGI